jgi:hypothetical protein
LNLPHKRGQIGEQAGEAAYRVVVVGVFGRGFGERVIRVGGRDGVGAFGCSCGFIVVLEEDWGQDLFHVPADVVGQHLQEQVGAHPLGQSVAERVDIEFALEGTEEPFDIGEVLLAQHHIVTGKFLVGQAGVQHIDAVEAASEAMASWLREKTERLVGDVQVKTLGHLELVAHLAQPQRDLVVSA